MTSRRHRSRRSALDALAAVGGLVVWGAHLGAVYAGTSLACTLGLGRATILGVGAVPLAIAVATGLALLAAGALLGRELRQLRRGGEAAPEPARRFLSALGAAVAAFSLVAIAWTAVPALVLPACRGAPGWHARCSPTGEPRAPVEPPSAHRKGKSMGAGPYFPRVGCPPLARVVQRFADDAIAGVRSEPALSIEGDPAPLPYDASGELLAGEGRDKWPATHPT